MARKKATPVEEETMKEEVPFEEKGNWSEPSGGMISQDTVGHLMKAATEFLGAMDTIMPKRKMPDEVRMHYKAAKKEMLLMARAILDAKIAECDGEKGPSAEEAPRVKKINLD
jgi:hypothetical protein